MRKDLRIPDLNKKLMSQSAILDEGVLNLRCKKHSSIQKSGHPLSSGFHENK